MDTPGAVQACSWTGCPASWGSLLYAAPTVNHKKEWHMPLTEKEVKVLKDIIEALDDIDCDLDVSNVESYLSSARDEIDNAESELSEVTEALSNLSDAIGDVRAKLHSFVNRVSKGSLPVEEVAKSA